MDICNSSDMLASKIATSFDTEIRKRTVVARISSALWDSKSLDVIENLLGGDNGVTSSLTKNNVRRMGEL